MEPARSVKKIEKPFSWQQLKNGQWVKQSIQLRLDEWCPKLFGYHMLKVGGLSCELSTVNSTIPHQMNLDIENPMRSIVADSYHLPFQEKSIDVVILAHQLDYCNDPHRLLREVDRVLVDDGYIIITGFNPISITGLTSFLPWRKHYLPWSGRMFTPNRISDWLALLNYQVIESDRYGLFPFSSYQTLWTWIENSRSGWARSCCSLYFIAARKRTYPIKPIKPHWKLKRSLSPLGVNYRVTDAKKREHSNS